MDDSTFSLASCIRAANPGPVLSGQFVPLNNIGPLRITYNWLYSALNCDPNDQSAFGWVLSKVGSMTGDSSVSLSPQQPYEGMTLYASVRDDYDYTLQVQAPFSADWITAVGGDETLTLTEQGFLTICLTGMNGQYVCADASQTTHDDHSGYLFHSSANVVGPASSFFVVVNAVYQNINLPLTSTVDSARIATALDAYGATDTQATLRLIRSLAS